MFGSVLVANRGEIARRVIRTLHALGIRSVAIYTDADAGAPHTREADEAVRVSSYLAIEEIVAIDADALHPGYGFLSENPALARACAQAGITSSGLCGRDRADGRQGAGQGGGAEGGRAGRGVAVAGGGQGV